MRNNERLSDLRFLCKDKVSVNVHSELFRQASPFMTTLLDITKEKQVRTVNIFNLNLKVLLQVSYIFVVPINNIRFQGDIT